MRQSRRRLGKGPHDRRKCSVVQTPQTRRGIRHQRELKDSSSPLFGTLIAIEMADMSFEEFCHESKGAPEVQNVPFTYSNRTGPSVPAFCLYVQPCDALTRLFSAGLLLVCFSVGLGRTATERKHEKENEEQLPRRCSHLRAGTPKLIVSLIFPN